MSLDGDSRGGRVRRRTAKAVDYAKEQDFSGDEDVFEDDADDDERAPALAKRRGRPRKSTSAQDDGRMEQHDDGDGYCNKIVYCEKGYDTSLPPLRERFPFLPEFEADGSPRIELIVGRRPVLDSKIDTDELLDDDHHDDHGGAAKRAAARHRNLQQEASPQPEQKKRKGGTDPNAPGSEDMEYEYLLKFKGKSYLHLTWKSGHDLESMNKSAKTLYRRYLKKIAAGTEEGLEDPDFDPAFIVPQKVVDVAEHEVTVALTDKELIEWEKEREKEIVDEEDADVVVPMDQTASAAEGSGQQKQPAVGAEEEKENKKEEWDEDIVDFLNLPIDKVRRIVNSDGPYYPVIQGSDNPYRDGYITEPPKKPRASYLFFQGAMRSYFQKKDPNASQSELLTILSDTWRNFSEEEQAPFVQLAAEEAQQHDKERAMMEKAQRPNEVWQPMRRCLMVLDRISSDGFANIFLEPVDLEEFTDYEDIVDQPMDLSTVRQKLASKKYQAPENFARDMRKVWNNCKVYNQHGSAIWFVADYMSKQFERLYSAWVQEFRDRFLRWANPKARPWEHTCRKCDGSCGTPDDKMILCDHCDAMYGVACLKMKKIPKGLWHCPECKPKLKTYKNIRLQSAMAEYAARRKAELGDVPKKKVMQTMYLVKWAGLGYEFCTWETKEDINDDSLIEEYFRLNKMTPDEPDLEEEEVDAVLDSMKHVSLVKAGGSHCIPDLRVQLYAQTRAFQFAKFASDIPDALASMVGPMTKATLDAIVDLDQEGVATTNDGEFERDFKDPDQALSANATETNLRFEVSRCVHDLVHRVIRGNSQELAMVNSKLPALLTGEYDAIIPITSKGLMMNVGEIHGSVAFLGYRSFPDGSKGPAELNNIIRNVGDKIIAVDGVSTIDKSFKQVILMLRESGKNKYAFMRFLENRFAVCNSDLTSVGNSGRYTVEELGKKFATDRQRLLVQRKQNVLVDTPVKKEADDDEEANPDDDGSDEEDGSEGEFEPDSDDDDLVKGRKSQKESPLKSSEPGRVASPLPAPQTRKGVDEETTTKDAPVSEAEASAERTESDEHMEQGTPESCLTIRQETTRSLAYRLLDVDVGYSSDEGGDEDCIYFIDGVDDTFTSKAQVEPALESFSQEDCDDKENSSKKKNKKFDNEDEEASSLLPMKRNEFSSLGERGKIVAAVAASSRPPDPSDFINFPDPSPKELEAIQNAEKTLMERERAQEGEAATSVEDSPSKTKRSTVKVEQVSVTTGEVIRVWANAETASATLQISLDDIRSMLKGHYNEELGDEVGGYRWRYALAGAEVTATGGSTRGSKKGKEAFLEFRDKLYDPAVPHVYKNGNKLRDYQVDGVNWLASTWYKRHSCILADEMGLGKTVQIVTYIEHIYRVEKIHRPFLVVVPLSTVEHWRREFLGWTDMVCCVYHDRQRIWRDVMREFEWYFEDRPHTPDFLKFDVLVTTYDTLIGDFDIIGQIPWRVAVVDEAHRLRNIKGKLLECMKEISARGTLQYGFQSRVLMTGTPLQNNTQELWTLLNFIEPFKFPSMEEFQAKFGNMANREQVEALQKKISPYMLRRVKEDVAKDIPAKEETVIDVELTSIQKQYYRAIFEHNHAFLSMGPTRSNAPKLMNIQMELRKCCNHPFLLDGVESREMEKAFNEFLEQGKFNGVSNEVQQELLNERGYVMTSGKMVLLDKLLPKLRAEGHKVLIFSQMVRMLDLISEYADFRGFRHERLDGRVRGNERQKAIDRFETEKDSFMFLLSTRAGGVGINLTAADTCIIFDSDWNPQNDVQAQARCHRIGQTKDVRIYRLVTSRTFEQEMFDRASKKLGLEQAVLGTFNNDNDDDKPTSKEMEQLLKKGAYALLDDEDEETNQFCADDIDAILAKRTRTRVVEGTKTASWLNKAGMVVSKSKFASEGASGGVDVDDPNFWQKVMPDFVTPQIMLEKLNELSDLVGGGNPTKKGIGRGRGRGRWKKKDDAQTVGKENHLEAENGVISGGTKKSFHQAPSDDNMEKALRKVGNGDVSDDDAESANTEEKEEEKAVLSRTNQRKVVKFMADLKSMMDGILEEAEDDSLQSSDKQACQKLLLTISIKENLFTDEQRHLARSLLKRLEGDRRRRCRTATDGPTSRVSNPRTIHETPEKDYGIPDDLLILSKQQRRKRRKDAGTKRRLKKAGDDEDDLDEDGYLRHSDDEGDWSDVGDDIYGGAGKKRAMISIKEARRRRGWAQDDDAATAAGRPWPAFPRHLVNQVLAALLDEIMDYDSNTSGGMFSEPVPRDQYPEYYEQIKKPMDYGTMKEKLERGEYRSAQAMQKDFILVMQNCVKFNSPNSDVVREARQQALMRPIALRNAAKKFNVFLAEDGSVLEIVNDEKKKEVDPDEAIQLKKKGRKKNDDADEDSTKKQVKRRRTKKKDVVEKEDADDDDTISEEEEIQPSIKKPRIKINLGLDKKPKVIVRKRKKVDLEKDDEEDAGADADVEKTPIPKKRRVANKKIAIEQVDVPKKKRKKVPENDESDEEPEKSCSPVMEETVVEPDAEKTLSLFMNVEYWKKKREALDGTFKATNALFSKHGPWKLPVEVGEGRFTEVANAVLTKMARHDHYSVFAEAVSEDDAPGYYDIVKNPMDFSKMFRKIESGVYGSGSPAAAALYEDFKLVFRNCKQYNDDGGEVLEEAIRLFGLLPETFAAACCSVSGKRKNKKERLSK